MAESDSPDRPTVGAFGNTYWAGRLAESLAGTPVRVRRLYVDREGELKGRSFRQWLADPDPWRCDVLHVLGWPTLWNLWLAARWRRVPVVYHWLGTDVSSFRASPRRSRVAGPALGRLIAVHLADSPTLVAELARLGIRARHETVGLRSFEGLTIPPMPAKPCALAMLRPDKFDFYGGREVLEMARLAPEIHWLIVAHDGTGQPKMSNVEYLGDLDSLDDVYERVGVLVRLTKHDGISQMVLEALARGRHVVWSYPMPHCRRAATAEDALTETRAALADGRPNAEGAAYVRSTFDPEAQRRRLVTMYRELAQR